MMLGNHILAKILDCGLSIYAEFVLKKSKIAIISASCKVCITGMQSRHYLSISVEVVSKEMQGRHHLCIYVAFVSKKPGSPLS